MTTPQQLDSLRVPLTMAMHTWPDVAPAAKRLLDALNSDPEDENLLRIYLATSLVMGWINDAMIVGAEVLSGVHPLTEIIRPDIGPDFDRSMKPEVFGHASLTLRYLNSAHRFNNDVMDAVHEKLTEEQIADLTTLGEIMGRMQNLRRN